MKTLVAIIFALVALAGCGSSGVNFAQDSPSPHSTTAHSKKTAKAEPKMTNHQKQAVGAARDYLDGQYFSKKGLIHQLKYEGHSTKDATFAVNYLHVDWNKQAAGAAKDYLDGQHFSRSGLIHQLRYEGYTKAQAEYGVKKAGL
jgi:Host cell surface-exposed lipoprotein